MGLQVLFLVVSIGVTVLFFLYGYNLYHLLGAARRYRAPDRAPPLTSRPPVAVHLPLYNERYVVARLIGACSRMADRYGRDLVRIVVIDDSDDDTAAEVDRLAALGAAGGARMEVLRRCDRQGYKAGALQAALEGTTEDFVVVFDADFVPPEDFLERTVPYLVADQTLGVVQARWGHLNRSFSPLTRAIALGIDIHFLVEQPARSAAGYLLNFNGSGGVLRTRALREAGGWQWDTLAEDLDASYRMQLRGYRILYLRDLTVDGEVPPSIPCYRRQQARWACGSLRTARKLLPRLLGQSSLGLRRRFQAFVHLTYYLLHPLMLLSFLLAAATAIFGIDAFGLPFVPRGLVFWGLLAAAIGACTFAALLCPLFVLWRQRLGVARNIPCVLLYALIGSGVCLSNSIEAAKALLFRREWSFSRTPKYAIRRARDTWRTKRYQVAPDPVSALEGALACVGALGIGLAWSRSSFGLVPILACYSLAFAVVSLLSLTGLRRSDRASRVVAPA